MGFLSASFGLTRYRVIGEADEQLWEKIPDLLKEFSFQEIDDVVEEISFGWVCFDNMLDTKWITSSPFKGEYVCFSLRIDKRKIPPAVFKKYYQLALQEMSSPVEQGLKFIPRAKKQEIKENLRLKLLKRILPVPSTTDIIWSYSKNIVYLSTTNRSTKGIFEDLFQSTFNLKITLINPYELGKSLENKFHLSLDKYETNIFC